MCFTCVAYTDLSFLTTDEIPESDLVHSKENIQAGYSNSSRIELHYIMAPMRIYRS